MSQSDPLVFAARAASLSDAALLAELQTIGETFAVWRQALRDEVRLRRVRARTTPTDGAGQTPN